jgi:type IV secretion system protein VirB4
MTLAALMRRRRRAALNRELLLADGVPYTAHLTPAVVHTRAGHYVQAFRIGGASFETADDSAINDWHERLNLLWRTIASPQLSVWTHLIRRRVVPQVTMTGLQGFAAGLQRAYQRRLDQERLRVSDLYLALVYRPLGAEILKQGRRLARRGNAEPPFVILRDALDTCEQLAEQLHSGLRRYDPERLETYSSGPVVRSGVLDYFGFLLNGESQALTVPRGPLSAHLATSRVFFGTEAIEYRLPSGRRLAAMLAIKEYPTPTTPGLLNALLRADYSLILTQSYTFLPKATAQSLLGRQFNRMVSAGDLAVSQAQALKIALDQLSSNEFVLGDHHLSLQVQTEIAAAEPGPAAEQWRALESSVADARVRLGDAGIVAAREDLALEAAFWGQLPGNFRERARRAPISSRNFAALAPFHNFPSGRATGNHWGEALAVLCTSSGAPYHLSLHASDPRDPDGGARKDTGHTFLCGPTGSGKTVFLGFCVAMLTRQGATQVVLDKDHGLEVLVRALGGEYRALESGRPTGLNPLQLEPDAANLEFMRSWLARLVTAPAGELTAREQADLVQALTGTMALPQSDRRLSRVLEFLDPTDPAGLHARLSRWSADTGGEYGWVFDHRDDRIIPLLGARHVLGFDVTDFLRAPDLRGPVTMYLFHLLRRLLDGRRLVVWMDEFATLLADSAFTSFAQDGLKTWRKMNAVAAFATQSAADVLHSPIARTLVEQTPTKVFFPNPDADRRDYVDGLGLSEREFALVRHQLAPGSRRFLLKQSAASVVCELDLKGMDLELKVISGRTTTVRRVRALIDQLGAEPETWLAGLANQKEDV